MPEVIFKTVHGSRLYGFEHAGSDYDTFTVTDSHARRVKQTIDDEGNDRVEVGIYHFLDLAMSGSHQSVEALFSPVKEWADTDAARRWRPLVENARVGGGAVFEKYERTIRRFCYGDFKRRRHAVRLRLNLNELRWAHRIDFVRLSDLYVGHCGRIAEVFEGDALAMELGVYKPRKEVDVGADQNDQT